MVNESVHVVIERNTTWEGEAASEPYEVGWAKEAIVFLEVLETVSLSEAHIVSLQISPDGIRWCDEGSVLHLPTCPGEVAYVRAQHFGGWLRVATSMPSGISARVMVSMHLKT
jgi:hypothetical protein